MQWWLCWIGVMGWSHSCWPNLLYLHVFHISQPTELELLEAKERNLVAGFSLTYVHCNFLVKGLDGTPTLFFAEMYPCCTREEDVILCTPLKENDSGHCFGCNYREKTHPTSVGCPGGHEDVIFPYGELDSDHDTFWQVLLRSTFLAIGVVPSRHRSIQIFNAPSYPYYLSQFFF